MTSRSYCFTTFELDTLPKEEYDGRIRYIVFQLELCPSSDRLHYQGYMELTEPMRMAGVKRAIGDNTMHLEKRRGTRDQARDYAMKDETREDGPWEFGDWKSGGQGKRCDLDNVVDLLQEGQSILEVADECPKEYIKYSKGIEKWKALHYPPRDWNEAPEVIVIEGPTGSGKTRWVYDTYGDKSIYHKMGGKWWDGYEQQHVVLFDDFDKDIIPYRVMLQILDRYPMRVEVKGASIELNSPVFVLTTNVPMEGWYPYERNIDALRRRVTRHEVLG